MRRSSAARLTLALALVLVSSAPGSIPARARGRGFTRPVVVTQANTAEPGIDIARDGTIYVNAPAGLLADPAAPASFLFRSSNGGRTFTQTPPGLRGALPGGGDSDVAIDPQTGALYYTDLWLGDATVAVSNDEGRNWIANPIGGPFVQDRQWLATTGGGRVYHVTHQIPTGLIVSRSIDGGVTYPVHTVAAHVGAQMGCICPPGTIVARRGDLLSDRVGVVYATSTGGIGFARSTDGALTFTNSMVSPSGPRDTAAAFPVVANPRGSRLVAVWLEIGARSGRVRFGTSPDWGRTWSVPRTIVRGGSSVYPWVDALGSKVAVSLYHTSTVAPPDQASEDTRWHIKYLQSTNGGRSFSRLIRVDDRAVKRGRICTGGIGCNGGRQLLDFQAVALDPAGRANVVWTRVLRGEDTQILFARQT